MKVLFLAHYPELYGSIRSLLDLTDGLQAYGIRPFFVVPAEGSFSAALQEKQLPYAIVPVPYWLSQKPLSWREKAQRLKEIRQAAQGVSQIISTQHIDLIYTNTSASPMGALAARKASLPHIWHLREGAYPDFQLRPIVPASWMARLLRNSGTIICNSNAVACSHFGSNLHGIRIVYNGVATQAQFEERLLMRHKNPKPDYFTFVMPSNYQPQKGQEEAIRALAAVQARGIQSQLVLAGNGKQSYLTQLQALSKELNIDKSITFLPYTDDALGLYYSSSCALVCSNYEALSRVALEAMSCGLPVIGRNTGGTPEIILDGQTGYLYDNFDALVESMAALAQNPALSQQMGLAGWARARELFNTEDCAAKVFEIIQSVTNKA